MRSIIAAALLACALSSGVAALAAPAPSESAYLAENRQAMDKMMAGMNVKPSGDVDRDFAAMMIPHHQGAIDMALLELRYGHNEQLRRLAQGIIVDQQQEIVVMRQAVGLPSTPGSQDTVMPMGGPG